MGLSRRRFLGAIAAASGLAAIGVERSARATTPDITPRRVERVIAPFRDLVGDVFDVRRTIPAPSVAQVSPFILLDHFDFRIEKGQLGGLAPHPHRGFETVTVLLEGAIEHGDSLGNRAVLESGAIQWMTAGSGIVHEENPANILRERGGRVLGIQLWVNLPARAKLTPPRYQDTTTARIPEAAEGGVRARVFAGRIHDVAAVIHTETAMTLVDYTLAPGSEVALEYPRAGPRFCTSSTARSTSPARRCPPNTWPCSRSRAAACTSATPPHARAAYCSAAALQSKSRSRAPAHSR